MCVYIFLSSYPCICADIICNLISKESGINCRRLASLRLLLPCCCCDSTADTKDGYCYNLIDTSVYTDTAITIAILIGMLIDSVLHNFVIRHEKMCKHSEKIGISEII